MDRASDVRAEDTPALREKRQQQRLARESEARRERLEERVAQLGRVFPPGERGHRR